MDGSIKDVTGALLKMKRTICSVLLALHVASPAYAHSPVPGIEGFYVGLLDPLVNAPQVLALLATGLLIGGFGKKQAVWPLVIFLTTSLLGILFGAGLLTLNRPLLLTAVLAGAVAALAPARVFAFCCVAAAAAGFLIGAVSIPDPGPVRDRIITVSGSFVGANLAVLYIFGALLYAKEKIEAVWLPNALRVLAGLVAAIAAAVLVSGLVTA